MQTQILSNPLTATIAVGSGALLGIVVMALASRFIVRQLLALEHFLVTRGVFIKPIWSDLLLLGFLKHLLTDAVYLRQILFRGWIEARYGVLLCFAYCRCYVADLCVCHKSKRVAKTPNVES